MTDLEAAKLIAQYAETLAVESDKRSAYGLLLDASVVVGRSEIGMAKLVKSGLIANPSDAMAEWYWKVVEPAAERLIKSID